MILCDLQTEDLLSEHSAGARSIGLKAAYPGVCVHLYT